MHKLLFCGIGLDAVNQTENQAFDVILTQRGVDAQVIVCRRTPDGVGIVAIVVGALLVGLLNVVSGRLFVGQVLALHDRTDAVVERRVQKDADAARIIPQYPVGTAADDDAVFLRGLADTLDLGLKDVVLGRLVLVGIAVHLTHQIVEQAVRHFFLGFCDEFGLVTGRTGSHLDEFLIIEGKTQTVGQLFGDVVTAAAELTANRDADRFLGGGLGSRRAGRR